MKQIQRTELETTIILTALKQQLEHLNEVIDQLVTEAGVAQCVTDIEVIEKLIEMLQNA